MNGVMRIFCGILLILTLALPAAAQLPDGDTLPDLAFDAESNQYLLAFEQRDASIPSSAIRGQLLDADGNALGNEIEPSSAQSVQLVHTAFDSTYQHYLTTWTQLGSGGTADIFGQLLQSDGTLLGEHITISDATGDQVCEAAAFNSINSRFLVVWNDMRGGDAHISGQLVNEDGTLMGETFPIFDAAPVDIDWCPAVAFDDEHERFLVVWSDTSSGAMLDIFGQLVNTDGSLQGTSFPISAPATVSIQRRPAIIFNTLTQQYLIVWQDRRSSVDYDLYAQLVDADGGLVGSNVQIDDEAGDGLAASIALDTETGQFLVLWSQDVGAATSHIFGRYLNADATVSGESFQLSTDPNEGAVGPAVAYNPLCGNFLISHATDTDPSELRTFLLGDPCETTPPTVTQTTPADGATDVAPGSAIMATFDKAMRASTLDTNSFTLDGGVSGSVSYDKTTNTATFTPNASLESNTTYTATVTTSVKDAIGNSLATDVSWSFQTAAAGGGCSLLRSK